MLVHVIQTLSRHVSNLRIPGIEWVIDLINMEQHLPKIHTWITDHRTFVMGDLDSASVLALRNDTLTVVWFLNAWVNAARVTTLPSTVPTKDARQIHSALLDLAVLVDGFELMVRDPARTPPLAQWLNVLCFDASNSTMVVDCMIRHRGVFYLTAMRDRLGDMHDGESCAPGDRRAWLEAVMLKMAEALRYSACEELPKKISLDILACYDYWRYWCTLIDTYQWVSTYWMKQVVDPFTRARRARGSMQRRDAWANQRLVFNQPEIPDARATIAASLAAPPPPPARVRAAPSASSSSDDDEEMFGSPAAASRVGRSVDVGDDDVVFGMDSGDDEDDEGVPIQIDDDPVVEDATGDEAAAPDARVTSVARNLGARSTVYGPTTGIDALLGDDVSSASAELLSSGAISTPHTVSERDVDIRSVVANVAEMVQTHHIGPRNPVGPLRIQDPRVIAPNVQFDASAVTDVIDRLVVAGCISVNTIPADPSSMACTARQTRIGETVIGADGALIGGNLTNNHTTEHVSFVRESAMLRSCGPFVTRDGSAVWLAPCSNGPRYCVGVTVKYRSSIPLSRINDVNSIPPLMAEMTNGEWDRMQNGDTTVQPVNRPCVLCRRYLVTLLHHLVVTGGTRLPRGITAGRVRVSVGGGPGTYDPDACMFPSEVAWNGLAYPTIAFAVSDYELREIPFTGTRAQPLWWPAGLPPPTRLFEYDQKRLECPPLQMGGAVSEQDFRL